MRAHAAEGGVRSWHLGAHRLGGTRARRRHRVREGLRRASFRVGCDAVVSTKMCASGSGTRERLGGATCEPVTDCNAPFPPAGATLFVKATYTAGEVDATHFKTLTEALAVATAGATIAVDAGTYAEKVKPTTAVAIVGRCAEQVTFALNDGTGPASASRTSTSPRRT